MLSLLIMNFARFDKKTYTHAHNDIQLQKQLCGKLT